MAQSRLAAYGGNEPVWGFVALLADERFTGQATVGIDPRVHLWVHEGFVYFAERVGATELTQRLVGSGAITAEQMAAGSVVIDGHLSLGRLFQRCPDIDRDVVELTVRITTESLLATIAESSVGMPEVHPLRHHPAGIHLWLRPDDENPLTAAHDASRPTERPPDRQAPPSVEFDTDLTLHWADPTPAAIARPAPSGFEWPVFADHPTPAVPGIARPHLDPTPATGIVIDAPPPLRSLAFLSTQAPEPPTETTEDPTPPDEPLSRRARRRARKGR